MVRDWIGEFMSLLDHFGFLAPYYETFIKSREPIELIRLAEFPIPGRLLDAGGGTGRVSNFLRECASQVVIADLSCRMLSEAKGKGGLIPVCSHTEKLPFPDSCFERVIMVDVLHHVCDQKETADELWRILKPGGKLIIEEPDVRKFAVKLIAWGEKMALMRSHFLSPPKIVALFDEMNADIRCVKKEHTAWVVVEKSV